MGQFEVNFCPRTTIKGQALSNFIVKFTYCNITEVTGMANNTEIMKATEVREKENSVPIERNAEKWTLYVDSAYNDIGSKAGMMLISPEGHKIHCSIRFGFNASNNEAEYEALIVGLRLVRELQVHNMKIFSDSQLVVN